MRRLGCDSAIDIRIELSDEAQPRGIEFVHDWGGRYCLKLGRTGTNWVFSCCFAGTISLADSGRSIALACPSGTDSAGLLDVVTRRILPRAATLFGATAVHGASLCLGDAGIMMLGPSGAGKSTLTAGLAAAGWQILSDDISVARSDGEPRLEPCGVGVCLWPESQKGLELPPQACAEMPGYAGKVYYDPEIEHRTAPAHLAACIVLQRSPHVERPRLETLGTADALRAVIRQVVTLNPVAPRAELAQTVDRLAELVAKSAAFQLTYPARYSSLPEISELLAAATAGRRPG